MNRQMRERSRNKYDEKCVQEIPKNLMKYTPGVYGNISTKSGTLIKTVAVPYIFNGV